MTARRPYPTVLDGSHVCLTPFSEAHIPELLAAGGGDDELWRWMLAPTPHTEEDLRKVVAAMLHDHLIIFTVFHKESGRAAGWTCYEFDATTEEHERLAMEWTWYGQSYRGSAVNTEAALLTLTHAFEELGIGRVSWEIDALNVRSWRAVERYGAVREGLFRRHHRRVDGTWSDCVRYSMIRSEWPAAKAAFHARLQEKSSPALVSTTPPSRAGAGGTMTDSTIPRTMAAASAPASPSPATDLGDLPTRGYARYSPQDLDLNALGGSWRDELARLSRAFCNLPHDQYAPEENRLRRYAAAVYLPWDDTLSWIPGKPDTDHGSLAEYPQARHPDYEDARYWPAIPDEARDNALLRHLMRFDVHQTLYREDHQRSPLYLAVHLMKLIAHKAGDAAVASPNCFHQDGDGTFTFAHLISRSNVAGGENFIARPECAGRQPDEVVPNHVHSTFTLDEPLESYAVYDPRVTHYVAPVRRGQGPGPGERCMILIGVVPFGPRL
ncbi:MULTISPECIES: 2OG-Fe dioxygenase family protein [unclassified Streptomyces]|uniref:2OG-Fe dioxygenase family protein n=1 Tax=unclassified Streptomyces TaxID=2593676 RepID=UPI00381CAA32